MKLGLLPHCAQEVAISLRNACCSNEQPAMACSRLLGFGHTRRHALAALRTRCYRAPDTQSHALKHAGVSMCSSAVKFLSAGDVSHHADPLSLWLVTHAYTRAYLQV